MTAKTDPKNQIGMFSDVGPLPSVQEALGLPITNNQGQSNGKVKKKQKKTTGQEKGEGGLAS